MTWTSYIAIGDSFSEGMVDPDPNRPNSFHGWTDRLAHILAVEAAAHGEQFRYANLAIRGRTMRPIIREQLQPALDQHPDLVSFVAGGNDMLRPNSDPDTLAEVFEDAVQRIRATGADVLLTTPTDPRDAPVFRLIRGKEAIFIANLYTIARRNDCYIADLWGLRSIQDWRMWGEDRLHLTPEGHHRVAVAAAQALGVPVDAEGTHPLEPAEKLPWRETLRSNGEWARTHVRPWLHRRATGRSSGDGIEPKRPVLTVLDPAEELPAPRF